MADGPTSGPWAFVLHKDGVFGGVAAADYEKRELEKFIGRGISKGFAVTTVFNRAEYNALLDTLKWRNGTPCRATPDTTDK